MKVALTRDQAKQLDCETTKRTKIPSLLLMEHAAFALASEIKKVYTGTEKVLFVCGSGNNGADGVAAARLLLTDGIKADIYFVGGIDHRTKEMELQMEIAKNLGLSIRSTCTFSEYNIIVDSIMGIGLNKPIVGKIAEIIQEMNEARAHAVIIAADLPTGVDADTGAILSIAVKADTTVCFGTLKRGLLFYPGAKYAGKVRTADIGLNQKLLANVKDIAYIFEKEDIKQRLPKRDASSNKGTYKRVLIFAGSEKMAGAAYMSAISAYRMGVGLVKVVTCEKILPVLMQLLPEAVYDTYEGMTKQKAKALVSWADVIVFGPGLSVSLETDQLLELMLTTIKEKETQLILDADGLNLLAQRMDNLKISDTESRISYIKEQLPVNTILTPHLLELSRLILVPVQKFHSNLIDIGHLCTYNSELIYVIKDARTVVMSNKQLYVNRSGNHGMSTGGSGDVLSGILAGLLAQRQMCAEGQTITETVALGIYLHGLAGDLAQIKSGARSMLARDIIEALPEVVKEYE